MKNRFLPMLALLVCTAQAAFAQVTFPLPVCVDRPALPVPTATAPAGVPAPLTSTPATTAGRGPCGPAVLEANAVGGAVAFFCKPANAPYQGYLYAVRWKDVTPAMVSDFAALALPGDNSERIKAMVMKHQTANVFDLCDVWGPARERINAAMPVVDAAVYKTPPSGTFTLYTVVNGARSSVVPGRKATAGATCDCQASKITVGTATYCPLKNATAPATNTSEVTLCQKAL